jgi:hypothetical protein
MSSENRMRDVRSLRPHSAWTLFTLSRALGARVALALGVAAASLVGVSEAVAQERLKAVRPAPKPGSGPVVAIAGREYAMSELLADALLGEHYRSMWTTPITVPVLDLSSFAGGLTPTSRGGNFQSVTLRLTGKDGKRYTFRSVNKWVRQGMPDDLKGTPVEWIVQDRTAAMHPAGALVASPILDAVGLLHAPPVFFGVMPDDPALGEFREMFAGMLGTMFENPETEKDGPERLFHGTSMVFDSSDFEPLIEESPVHRIDSQELLKARLVDLIIGDADRGPDQWLWARFGQPGAYTWRPVPRDRDISFVEFTGLAGEVGRMFIPKLVSYGDSWEGFHGYLDAAIRVDRAHLTDLDKATWDRTVREVQAALTDRVIEQAVMKLPPEYKPLNADFIRSAMLWRRDNLQWAADYFYASLVEDVDVLGTDADETALVERRSDGSVEVSLFGPRTGPLATELVQMLRFEDESDGRGPQGNRARQEPQVRASRYFHRVFSPSETKELRVYMRGGNDRVLVRGESGGDAISLRVIGGGGDDVLADSSSVGGSRGEATAFYDSSGENRFVTPGGTHVSDKDFHPALGKKSLSERAAIKMPERDWGQSSGPGPFVDRVGVVGWLAGVSLKSTDYQFRRLPWGTRKEISVFTGVTRGGIGGEASIVRRLESSKMLVSLSGRATRGLSGVRYYGYGNDSQRMSKDEALILGNDASLSAALGWDFEHNGQVSLGPTLRWRDLPAPDGMLEELEPYGIGSFTQAGGVLDAKLAFVNDNQLPSKGVTFRLTGAGYAPLLDNPDWYGSLGAETRLYVPVVGTTVLALRGGGEQVWGQFPLGEGAVIGGRQTLRGYETQRFTGDRALYGSAELRVPIFDLTLLARGKVGVFGLADAGRVWLNDASPGGWHRAYGGGIWYQSFGYAMNVAYAKGSEPARIHIGLGLPF